MKKQMISFSQVFCSVTTLSFAACHVPQTQNVTQTDSAQTTRTPSLSPNIAQFFTPEQINAVYSNESSPVSASQSLPKSKPALTQSHKNGDQLTASFTNQTNNFSITTEARGYINLGHEPTSFTTAKLIRIIQKTSDYKSITSTSGKQIFADTFRVNEKGQKISDNVTGAISDSGETIQAKVYPQLSFLTPEISVSFHIEQQGDDLVITGGNTSSVSVPLVGTIIPTKGMNIKAIVSPYKNGWLFYATENLKLDQFADKLPPSFIESMLNAIINWVKARTVIPTVATAQ